MLEPYDGKLSRTVLRREGGGNTADPADNGERFWIEPIYDSDTFAEDSKFQLTAFTEEELKKYENTSKELLAHVKQKIGAADNYTEVTSLCVTARNIGGKVYVVYVREIRSK